MYQPDITTLLEAIKQEFESIKNDNKSLKQENSKLIELNNQYLQKIKELSKKSKTFSFLKIGSDWSLEGDNILDVSLKFKTVMDELISSISISYDGQYIAFVSGNNVYLIIEKIIYQLDDQLDNFTKFFRNKRLRRDSLTLDYSYKKRENTKSVYFSPDSHNLFVLENEIIKMWDVEKKMIIREIKVVSSMGKGLNSMGKGLNSMGSVGSVNKGLSTKGSNSGLNNNLNNSGLSNNYNDNNYNNYNNNMNVLGDPKMRNNLPSSSSSSFIRSLCSNGDLLYVISSDKSLRIFDKDKLISVIPTTEDLEGPICLSQDNKNLYCKGKGSLIFFDLGCHSYSVLPFNNEMTKEMTLESSRDMTLISSLGFLCVSTKTALNFYKTSPPKLLSSNQNEECNYCLGSSGNVLIVGHKNGISFYDIKNKRKMKINLEGSSTYNLDCSNKRLVTVENRNTIRVWKYRDVK